MVTGFMISIVLVVGFFWINNQNEAKSDTLLTNRGSANLASSGHNDRIGRMVDRRI